MLPDHERELVIVESPAGFICIQYLFTSQRAANIERQMVMDIPHLAVSLSLLEALVNDPDRSFL